MQERYVYENVYSKTFTHGFQNCNYRVILILNPKIIAILLLVENGVIKTGGQS